MKVSEILDPLPPDLARILGPRMPPDVRAEIVGAIRREPPPRLSQAERAAMYHPEAEREDAELRKLKAEANKAEAEAKRTRAEAADRRRRSSRRS